MRGQFLRNEKGQAIEVAKIIGDCLFCFKQIESYPSRIKKYCGLKCSYKHSRVLRKGNGNPMFNKKPWNYGLDRSDPRVDKYAISNSETKKGMEAPLTAFKQGNIPWNYNTGYSPLIRRMRGWKPYKDWRLDVFKRDNYKCIVCSSNENIEADHIKSFSKYPDTRFDISNGRTLCHNCHIKTDNYGVKSWRIKEEQWPHLSQ